MASWIFIVIAVITLIVPVLYGIYKLIKTSKSNRITFIKDNKRITILSGNLSAEDIKELVNF